MKLQKPNTHYIRYWHPRKGGWYNGTLVSFGRKWAIIRELGGEYKTRRVPASSVREVET